MPFLLAFTLFALLDFVLLFSVGSQIGLLLTLALVLATGFIGLHMIRREGVATFARARERMERGEIPSNELLTGAALIFGGALLMAPGFLSDALGFICLIPDARRRLGRLLAWLGVRLQAIRRQGGGSRPGTGPEADWAQAGQDRDVFRQQRDPKGEGTREAPLEGDFIHHDEPRR